jgi:hypothetical protein
MSKPRKPPKHRFRRPRLSAAVLAGIDAITDGNPELRAALVASVPALDGAFLAAFTTVPPHVRATMTLAFRDAVMGLGDGKDCDYHPQVKAATVRYLAIGRSEYSQIVTAPTGDGSFVGFTIVCPSCDRLPTRELVRRMVKQHAAVLRQSAEQPCRRHVAFGLRIGEPGPLPRRHMLEACGDCQAMLWINQDDIDRIAPDTPLCLCRPCAIKWAETGRLEAVPTF